MALPLGVEPRSSVPETNVLSIELQEHYCYKIFKGQSGQIDYHDCIKNNLNHLHILNCFGKGG